MTTRFNASTIAMAERGYLPDKLLRLGIRQLLSHRLADMTRDTYGRSASYIARFAAEMEKKAIAPHADEANSQHYELPTEFFQVVLGQHLKYSCGYWDDSVTTLDEAEALALQRTCEHAEIEDGMDILELGCGWGSLSLWMAEHYPNAHITSVTNSSSQADHIRDTANARKLTNLCVVVADANVLMDRNPAHENQLLGDTAYDRIVSVEMFEHLNNWPSVFDQVLEWLHPHGKLFMHIFCHRTTPYHFRDDGDEDWMARHFFTGGIMPSEQLPVRIAAANGELMVTDHWRWSGEHYQKTCEAWLNRMDANESQIRPILDAVYGVESDTWWNRWRLFFMACSELFAWRRGKEWSVGHYLISRRVPGLRTSAPTLHRDAA